MSTSGEAQGYGAIATPPSSSSQRSLSPTKPSSHRTASAASRHSEESNERAPLIASSDEDTGADRTADDVESAPERKKRKVSWPIVSALITLFLLIVGILVVGFIAPDAVQQYAKEATVLDVKSLSVDSFSSTGARVRVKGSLQLDSSRVDRAYVRRIGKFGTSIARKVSLGGSTLQIKLPDYADGLLGTATYPDMVFDIRSGQVNEFDFLSDCEPGQLEMIKQVAKDYLDNNLSHIKVEGQATVAIKSGVLSLGKQFLSQVMDFQQVPSLPGLNITRLNINEVKLPEQTALGVDVSALITNDYPLEFTIPPLGFSVFLPGCSDALAEVAVASTNALVAKPHLPIKADVHGVISSISHDLTQTCPGTDMSPMDAFLGAYIRGAPSTVYVKGLSKELASPDTPTWLVEILNSVTVPVPFPGGHTFDNLIKSFSLTDVDFQLPSPIAEPDSQESFPQLSASVKAVVSLPEEMNVHLDVSSIMADASLYYKGSKFGELHVNDWVPAKTKVQKSGDMEILARFEDVPLNITDNDVFSEVVAKLLFGGGGAGVRLEIKGTTDVKVEAAQLGVIIVRDIPAEGNVLIKGGDPSKIVLPKAHGISITGSTKRSISLAANVTFTNPTNYTAIIPYANIQIVKNDSILGNCSVRNLHLGLGDQWAMVDAIWSPLDDGKTANDVALALLSDYVSGVNTTIVLRPHAGSIPSLPGLSKALEFLHIEIPTPQISGGNHSPDDGGGGDGDDDDDDDDGGNGGDKQHFVKSATLHLFSSTGTFILDNPLEHTPLYMSRLTGTASHNGTLLGTINYTYPIVIPPGLSETPKLPVEWTLDGVGYDLVKRTLGGTLKVDAVASCNIEVGEWEGRMTFHGGGIGAHVRW